MSKYEAVVTWVQGARGVIASCQTCPWMLTDARIANVRMHILANPTHKVVAITTSTMEFRHASPRTTAHVA